MSWQSEDHEEQPGYVRHVLTHRYALLGLLFALLASVVLLVMYTAQVAAAPLLAYAALLLVAVLSLPRSPAFRSRVDALHRQRRRERTRAELKRDLLTQCNTRDPHWQAYQRMIECVDNLRGVVRASELERLQDASVEYLSLWSASLSMNERLARLRAENLDQKLARLDAELERAHAGARARLEEEQRSLVRLQASQARLEARAGAVQAALLASSDAVEEMLEHARANPSASTASQLLQEAVARLRVEDELDAALGDPRARLPLSAAASAHKVSSL